MTPGECHHRDDGIEFVTNIQIPCNDRTCHCPLGHRQCNRQRIWLRICLDHRKPDTCPFHYTVHTVPSDSLQSSSPSYSDHSPPTCANNGAKSRGASARSCSACRFFVKAGRWGP